MPKNPLKELVKSINAKENQVSSENQEAAPDSDSNEQVLLDETVVEEIPLAVQEELVTDFKPKASPVKSFLRIVKLTLLWFVTIVLILLAIGFFPSATSFALGISAILTCPLKVLQDLNPFKRFEAKTARGIVAKTGAVVAPLLLAILGIAVAPASGESTLGTYLDLQSAKLSQPDYVEYSLQSIDATELVSCDNPNVILTAQDPVNAAIVGTQTLNVSLTEGSFSKTESVTFVVKDTQPPVITLTKPDRSYPLGETIDLLACFTVEDPVDGELAHADKQPQAHGTDIGNQQIYEDGWFTVDDSDVDLKKPGTYQVIVTAADKHGNEDKGSFTITIIDPLEGVELKPSTDTLEYSLKSTDPTKLVTCSIDDVKISATNLDLSKIGAQKVTYTLTKGSSTKKVDITYTVKDTKSPSITLVEENPTITEGDSFDPYGYVSSVTDPVDGELERVDAKPENNGGGWYTIEGDYDANKDGVYFLTVLACDKNGNQTSKELKLTVNEPAIEEQAAEPVDNAKDYVVNTNTGKFHRPSCRHVNKISDSNRWDVHTDRQELIDEGYEPCKVCNP